MTALVDVLLLENNGDHLGVFVSRSDLGNVCQAVLIDKTEGYGSFFHSSWFEDGESFTVSSIPVVVLVNQEDVNVSDEDCPSNRVPSSGLPLLEGDPVVNDAAGVALARPSWLGAHLVEGVKDEAVVVVNPDLPSLALDVVALDLVCHGGENLEDGVAGNLGGGKNVVIEALEIDVLES